MDPGVNQFWAASLPSLGFYEDYVKEHLTCFSSVQKVLTLIIMLVKFSVTLRTNLIMYRTIKRILIDS